MSPGVDPKRPLWRLLLRRPARLRGQSRCRRFLDGGELAAVRVVLDLGESLDQKLVAGHKADTPAGHVV